MPLRATMRLLGGHHRSEDPELIVVHDTGRREAWDWQDCLEPVERLYNQAEHLTV